MIAVVNEDVWRVLTSAVEQTGVFEHHPYKEVIASTVECTGVFLMQPIIDESDLIRLLASKDWK